MSSGDAFICPSIEWMAAFCQSFLNSVRDENNAQNRLAFVVTKDQPRAPFWPASFKVKPRSFKPLNSERYPGGPPFVWD
jgi:hypothetical protein